LKVIWDTEKIILRKEIEMAELNIVLVEPQIPQNTGNIARTCAVTGARLHLIRPLGFEISDRNLKRAGLDYWDKLDITYYDGLDDFFEKTDGNYYFFTSKGQHVHSDIKYPDKCYLIFGREDAGLPEELLFKNPDFCARIPMRNTLRCLNLSNSVAVASYEVLRQWGYPELTVSGELTNFEWE
jgi:tRNA (cytidine/uridine-2'-O-)-methyltransferase